MSIIGAIIPAFMVRKIPPVQALRPGLPSNEKKKRDGVLLALAFYSLVLLLD